MRTGAMLLTAVLHLAGAASAAEFEIASTSWTRDTIYVVLRDASTGLTLARHGIRVDPERRSSLSASARGLGLRYTVEPSGKDHVEVAVEVFRRGRLVEVLQAEVGRVAGLDGEQPIRAMAVGGDVKPPRIVSRVDPPYTDDALEAKISGLVVIELVLDETGAVRQASVLKGLPYGLGRAALDAVMQWRFEPGTLHGEPVPVIYTVTISFKLP